MRKCAGLRTTVQILRRNSPLHPKKLLSGRSVAAGFRRKHFGATQQRCWDGDKEGLQIKEKRNCRWGARRERKD